VARIEALQIREIGGQKLEFWCKLDDESRILIRATRRVACARPSSADAQRMERS
jgi:hypothetical protein